MHNHIPAVLLFVSFCTVTAPLVTARQEDALFEQPHTHEHVRYVLVQPPAVAPVSGTVALHWTGQRGPVHKYLSELFALGI